MYLGRVSSSCQRKNITEKYSELRVQQNEFLLILKSYYRFETYSKEYNWNIEWTENLIRNYYQDEEIAVVSHNDLHAGNMMMDKNDTTADSLILIDWDLAQYGYRNTAL